MELVLCPHCMAPLQLGDTECSRCREDTTRQGPVRMDDETYYEKARKACMYCGASMLELAVTCPSCMSRQPE